MQIKSRPLSFFKHQLMVSLLWDLKDWLILLFRYEDDNIFIAEINNEKVQNNEYKENLLKLDTFVMVQFTEDTEVVPRESEWFGYYQDGTLSTLHLYFWSDCLFVYLFVCCVGFSSLADRIIFLPNRATPIAVQVIAFAGVTVTEFI